MKSVLIWNLVIIWLWVNKKLLTFHNFSILTNPCSSAYQLLLQRDSISFPVGTAENQSWSLRESRPNIRSCRLGSSILENHFYTKHIPICLCSGHNVSLNIIPTNLIASAWNVLATCSVWSCWSVGCSIMYPNILSTNKHEAVDHLTLAVCVRESIYALNQYFVFLCFVFRLILEATSIFSQLLWIPKKCHASAWGMMLMLFSGSPTLTNQRTCGNTLQLLML